MTEKPDPTGLQPPSLIDAFRARMDTIAQSGAPGLRAFAAWLAEQPEELAFHSVRSLADLAGADPNVVVRCMKAAGYDGYAQARRSVQDALRQPSLGYSGRADALQNIAQQSLHQELQDAAKANTQKAFSPALWAQLEQIVPHLLSARRVHCIGVRMAFAPAHYFTYRGRIAHANIAPTPPQPGLILDSLIDADARDVVIVISFTHYATETLRAAQVAHSRGARVLAVTDRRDSPLVPKAWQVLRAPVDGPHVMYSLAGAMLIIENLLELMSARDPQALQRIESFEKGLISVGAYVRQP